jgi:hypothetical protein
VTKVDHKPDLNYLIEFEKKYCMKLWMTVYSDRTFYKYNKYYKFSKNEIQSIIERECKLFEAVLDEVKPDYIITKLPDYNQSELLFQLGKARKIPILMLNNLRFGFRYYISNQPEKIDNFEELLKKTITTNKTFSKLREENDEFSKKMSRISKKFGTSSKGKFKASFRYFSKICNNEYRKYYVNYGRTRIKMLIKETLQIVKRSVRQKFLDDNCIRNIDQKKSVYFPLHFQPERATLLTAPFYENQIEVIEAIARSLPIDYTLYVKDHPIQIRTGWKSIGYYKKILNMPNVKLLHPSVSTKKIFQSCELVCSISGTSSFEFVFYEKPSIIFADTIFSSFSSVHKVDSLENLSEIIQKALKNKVDINELNKFTNCLIENSFEHDGIGLAIKMQDQFFEGGYYYDYDINSQKLDSFLKENEKIFENLAIQYMNKIKTHQLEENQK